MEFNSIGDEGAKHIAEGLKENTALTQLEYVTAHTLCLHHSLSLLNVVLCSLFARKRQQPLTCPIGFACRLQLNDVGPEGAKHLSEGLKENKALTSLEYAAAHRLPAVSSP